ncbi:MAG: hypothetical protein U0136_20590 [Bdellovibrionota bacterium]
MGASSNFIQTALPCARRLCRVRRCMVSFRQLVVLPFVSFACVTFQVFTWQSAAFADDNHFSDSFDSGSFDSPSAGQRFGFQRPSVASRRVLPAQGALRNDYAGRRYRAALDRYAVLLNTESVNSQRAMSKSETHAAETAPTRAMPRVLTEFEQLTRRSSAATADFVRNAYQRFLAPSEAAAAEVSEPISLEEIESYVKWRYHRPADGLDHF